MQVMTARRVVVTVVALDIIDPIIIIISKIIVIMRMIPDASTRPPASQTVEFLEAPLPVFHEFLSSSAARRFYETRGSFPCNRYVTRWLRARAS